ncbi:MAG: hypothetical protein IPM80_15375 [Proteobacteria bacterium]|nr:hypothetical protein [Pseudomonadota bacterium]
MSQDPVSTLQATLGLILSVSIASERLVEIIKGMSAWLNEAKPDPRAEGCRRSALQALAVASGIATAFLAQPLLAPMYSEMSDHRLACVAVGLLASGGSGFWNAILSYVLQVKELKKQEVITAQSPAVGGFNALNLGAEQVTSNECYDVEDK